MKTIKITNLEGKIHVKLVQDSRLHEKWVHERWLALYHHEMSLRPKSTLTSYNKLDTRPKEKPKIKQHKKKRNWELMKQTPELYTEDVRQEEEPVSCYKQECK